MSIINLFKKRKRVVNCCMCDKVLAKFHWPKHFGYIQTY